MTTMKWLAVICLVTSAGVRDAQAQMTKWEDRGYVAVNYGVQAKSQEFTESIAQTIYGESATLVIPHSVSGGGLFDIAAGWRVWQNLAVGVGYSRFSDSETPTLTAQIPNPFFGGARRTATADPGNLSHNESAIHLQLYWNLPLTEEFEMALVAGPSFYKIEQDFIAGMTLREGAFPFTTVAITSVAQTSLSERATGFTLGVDGTYRLTPRYGVGAFARYSGASADMGVVDGGTVKVDAGGFQLGGGLRVRF
jgi:hypothetical protein